MTVTIATVAIIPVSVSMPVISVAIIAPTVVTASDYWYRYRHRWYIYPGYKYSWSIEPHRRVWYTPAAPVVTSSPVLGAGCCINACR